MTKQHTPKSKEINWNCRFHPNEGWHEVGCPHKEWTKEQLQDALERAKASSNMAIEAIQQAIAQERERIAEVVTNMSSDWESRVSIQDVLHVITNNHEDHKE